MSPSRVRSLPTTGGRAERWRELFARARPTVTQTPLGLRLAFAPAPGVEQELQELAALERVCCAFADWSVSAAGSEVVLEVAADGPEAVAAVHAMFRL